MLGLVGPVGYNRNVSLTTSDKPGGKDVCTELVHAIVILVVSLLVQESFTVCWS